jgi:hypothetical protein
MFNSIKKGKAIFKAPSRNLDISYSHQTSVINTITEESSPKNGSPGPGAYFNQIRPFLKKSYNASLTRKRFY